MSQRDYYEVLGVSRDADEAAIKSAYRKLAMKFHPDRNKEDGAADRFKEATEAYAVLSDGQKRAAYDRFGHAGVRGQAGGGVHFNNIEEIFSQFSDIFGGRGGGIFENLFGGGFGGGRRSPQGQRGRNLGVAVDIDLIEVVHGAERTLALKRAEECPTCKGTGAAQGSKPETCRVCRGRGQVQQQQGFFAVRTACPECQGSGETISDPCRSCAGSGQVRREREIKVQIPAGIEDGAQIRLAGQGEPGRRGGPMGDLFVEVRVRPDSRFHREGRDLYVEVPITYAQAVLGDKIRVGTLEGEARMTVPSGTPTGKLFRLKNQGLPKLHGGSRGDVFVRVFVEVPAKPSRQEKAIIKQLFEAEKERRSKTENAQ